MTQRTVDAPQVGIGLGFQIAVARILGQLQRILIRLQRLGIVALLAEGAANVGQHLIFQRRVANELRQLQRLPIFAHALIGAHQANLHAAQQLGIANILGNGLCTGIRFQRQIVVLHHAIELPHIFVDISFQRRTRQRTTAAVEHAQPLHLYQCVLI